jgi:dTDP-4-amino-4,6-dideoxygalactose transaminase
MTKRPSFLGGAPAFPKGLPFVRPTIEEPRSLLDDLQGVLESGKLTDGPMVRRLEEDLATEFQVEHCVAVSSCTAGLMLVIQALELQGPVLVPSFTFMATAHAVTWNGLGVLFADCDPDTWCLGPQQVHGNPALIVGVHVSGVPCDVDGLAKKAGDVGASLIYDSAHAAGSRVMSAGASSPLGGFGMAEVFSLTPTKVLSGAEGGFVTTNDASLGGRLRMARNYGNPGDYDSRFPGLNARLSELHAAMALSALRHLEERVANRNQLADLYRELLAPLGGIGFQKVPSDARSSFKDFTVLIDRQEFGCSRDAVAAALAAEGIDTRAYYSPPVHMQSAYRRSVIPTLPATERLAGQVLSLPMWSHLPNEAVERVGEAFTGIRAHAEEIEARFQLPGSPEEPDHHW